MIRLKMILMLLAATTLGLTVPQDYQDFRRRGQDRYQDGFDPRNGVPVWENDKAFADDVFTFVRIRYSSYRRGYGWSTDYPDADLNLSYRLQELTAIKTDPHGRVLELTDPDLFEYPFIYLIEPGRLYFSEEEVLALRSYLLRGGFLMVDDFWGEDEWANFDARFVACFRTNRSRKFRWNTRYSTWCINWMKNR